MEEINSKNNKNKEPMHHSQWLIVSNYSQFRITIIVAINFPSYHPLSLSLSHFSNDRVLNVDACTRSVSVGRYKYNGQKSGSHSSNKHRRFPASLARGWENS